MLISLSCLHRPHRRRQIGLAPAYITRPYRNSARIVPNNNFPLERRAVSLFRCCFITSIGLSLPFAMFSRALWARQVAPLRRQAIAPFAARRSVTTDAASSHAEDIPQVKLRFFRELSLMSFRTLTTIFSRRMTSPSRSGSRMRASRRTSSTLLRTLWRRPRGS